MPGVSVPVVPAGGGYEARSPHLDQVVVSGNDKLDFSWALIALKQVSETKGSTETQQDLRTNS